jgi:hypothetical protein
LPFSMVRALPVIVEVCSLRGALLEEEDSEALVPPLTRSHVKASHALVLDELGKHEALPTNQGLYSGSSEQLHQAVRGD